MGMECGVVNEITEYYQLNGIAECDIEDGDKIKLACFCIIDLVKKCSQNSMYNNILKNALLVFVALFLEEKIEEEEPDVDDLSFIQNCLKHCI
jgi:hypothetical protein